MRCFLSVLLALAVAACGAPTDTASISASDRIDLVVKGDYVVAMDEAGTVYEQGAVAIDGEDQVIVPGLAVDAVDTTGAGDCFVGYLAAGLAQAAALEDALVKANAAAARSVQRRGAAPSMPSAEDLPL